MIPSFATSGVLTAPSAALILSGYVSGNTLAAQHLNWYLGHITLELNNLLTLGGVIQNTGNDNQVGAAVQNVTQKILGIMNCVRVTTGSALTVPIGSGTIIVAMPSSGSCYTVTLPSAASALVAGFEVDVQLQTAGATGGSGSCLVNLLNVNDSLAGYTGGTWQITESGGHLRVRPALSSSTSGYGYVVESCDGTVYRNVITSTQTASVAVNTWSNQGGSLTLGPGIYEIEYKANATDSTGTCVFSSALSNASTTANDQDLIAVVTIPSATQTQAVARRKRIVVVSSTTYYLNCLQTAGTHTIGFAAASGSYQGSTIIEAKRVG